MLRRRVVLDGLPMVFDGLLVVLLEGLFVLLDCLDGLLVVLLEGLFVLLDCLLVLLLDGLVLFLVLLVPLFVLKEAPLDLRSTVAL